MESRQDSGIAVTLIQFRLGENAGQVAEATVWRLREIEAALSPIIGPRGVTALLKRSLYLTRGTYPWLIGGETEETFAILEALKAAVAQESDRNAAAGGEALLQTFAKLLGNLIGEALTERLMSSSLHSLNRSHLEKSSR